MPPAILGTRGAKPAAGAAAARPVVPFIRAAYEHFESAWDNSTALAVNATNIGPFDVPAHGYMRAIWLLVEGSGGVLGAGVLHEDYPFVVLDSITLLDVNGQPIVGPHTGYDLYLMNLLGGYAWDSDATAEPDYIGTINCNFALRIPVEATSWDGFGSLANQNASAQYRVAITLAAEATAFTTVPTTRPTIRTRGYLESWTQPVPADALGNPQEQMPPGHPSTQFWSVYARDTIAGEQTHVLNRVGNWIRTIIFVVRNATPVRTTNNWPDPVRINLDGRQLWVAPRTYIRRQLRQRVGVAPPAGVFALTYTHDQDGHTGNENRDLWLPTVQATRLEVVGTFAAGTMRILTNDVAPATPGGR